MQDQPPHPVANDLGATTPSRSCGECTACCQVMAVSCIDKPAHTPCVYLTVDGDSADSELAPGGGCSIYPNRPDVCAGFVCLWLRDTIGITTEDDRPDRSGIIITASSSDGSPSGSAALIAREVFAGASKTEIAKALIRRLRSFVPLRVLSAPRKNGCESPQASIASSMASDDSA